MQPVDRLPGTGVRGRVGQVAQAAGDQRFRLELCVSVHEVDESGYRRGGNNGLEVRNTLDLGAMDFMGVAQVLGRFHDLATDVARGDDTCTCTPKGSCTPKGEQKP